MVEPLATSRVRVLCVFSLSQPPSSHHLAPSAASSGSSLDRAARTSASMAEPFPRWDGGEWIPAHDYVYPLHPRYHGWSAREPKDAWTQLRDLMPPGTVWIGGLFDEWVQCDWCWAWTWGPYWCDNMPQLCVARCLPLAKNGGEPPWWPNERQRCEARVDSLFLSQRRHTPLPGEVCKRIAAFLAHAWMP